LGSQNFTRNTVYAASIANKMTRQKLKSLYADKIDFLGSSFEPSTSRKTLFFGTENTANLLILIKNNTVLKLKLIIIFTDVSNYINLVHHQCMKI